VSQRLRWTEQAVDQLGAIAEYISLASPVYAEGMVGRIAAHIRLALDYPDLGRQVPERDTPEIRELIERPYRIIYRRHVDSIEVLAVVHERQDMRKINLG
jgi:plasmid stabilization system protein ParE